MVGLKWNRWPTSDWNHWRVWNGMGGIFDRNTHLGGLAPYRVEHINRFGDYSLDLERQVQPMKFETKLI